MGSFYKEAAINGSLDGNAMSYTNSSDTIADQVWQIGHISGQAKLIINIKEMSMKWRNDWNDELTSSEVTALYNSGTALDARANSGNYTSKNNLSAYYKMEEGSGNTLTIFRAIQKMER